LAIKVLTNRGHVRFWRAKSLHAKSLHAKSLHAKSLRRPFSAASLTAAISAIVDGCIRRPWLVIGVAMALAAA
jgi:hypothetical protein